MQFDTCKAFFNEVNTYETTDGGAIKVSMQYGHGVSELGYQIYMGLESQSPVGYGWTKLEVAK